jgi:hypothetical protein
MAQVFCTQCRSALLLESEGVPSPVPGLIGTNEVPSSLEEIAIQKFLANVANDIQKLESQML